MEELITDYREFLKNELDARKSRNSQYSLRSFAQYLEIDATLLSKTLLRKQHFSLKTADKVCRRLKLGSEVAKEFMDSVAKGSMCNTLYSLNPQYTSC